MAFDSPFGYLLSISLYMQIFTKIFHCVQQRAKFIFFSKIWSSAKPRTKINVILQSLGLDLVNIKVQAKFIKIFKRFKGCGHFSRTVRGQKTSQTVHKFGHNIFRMYHKFGQNTFYVNTIWTSAQPRAMTNGI